MPNPKAIKRKLNKKVINNLGFDTMILRSDSATQLDSYGEPINSPWPFIQMPIRIVVDIDKRDNEGGEIGGLADDKREYFEFFCSGDSDIKLGDKIVYPANTPNQWFIDKIEPITINNVVVIIEARAYKDNRY